MSTVCSQFISHLEFGFQPPDLSGRRCINQYPEEISME